MEKFIDDIAEITWYKDDLGYDANQLNSELDSWKSDEINEFVTGGTNLGYMTRGTTMFATGTEQFYGFINNKLVSTVLLRENKLIDEDLQYQLLTHIQNNKRGFEFQNKNGIISTDKAFQLLERPDFSEVSYLIVKPAEQGKGYGTRIVTSIKNNLDFFMPNATLDAFGTTINFENIPSINVFNKNGFKQLNTENDEVFKLNKYFLEEEMEK